MKKIIHENCLYQYDSNGEVKWIGIIIKIIALLGQMSIFDKEESNYSEEFYFKELVSVETNFLILGCRA